MGALRQVEERDSKGNTTRMNPTIVWRQDMQIRKVVGRHDFAMLDNPDYHEPITVQVQEGKAKFFSGLPDTTNTRAMAKELKISEVPEYIVNELKKHPIKVREARPTVYEIKIATVGDVEVTELAEIPNDGQSVTITPVAPILIPKTKSRASTETSA